MKKQSQCLSACHDQSQWNGDILCFRQKRDERKRRRRCLDLKTSKQTNKRTNQRCRIWFLNNFAKGSVNKKLDMLQTQKVKTSAAVDRSQSSKSWQVLASRHTWARSGHEKSTPTTGRFYLFRFSTFFKILIIKLKPPKTLAQPKEHSQVNKATQPLLNWALTVFCDKDVC